MKRTLVVGNWKMHGDRTSVSALAHAILEGSSTIIGAEIAVCPPYVYLPMVAEIFQHSSVAWGAQNVAAYKAGAYTGEISALMLRDFQCKYVIVGHSERRQLFHENSELVIQKSLLAVEHGLQPIICVGETLEERNQGLTEAVITKQLAPLFEIKNRSGFWQQIIIAYEPIWAIGTGITATPEQAQQVHACIRSKIRNIDPQIAETLSILYGGSVKSDNAKALFTMPDIDGGLIGGASLKADEFLEICRCG